MHTCGDNNIINYENVIGSGTHGIVYGTFINPNIVAKVFNIRECDTIKNKEVAIHEYVHEMFHKYNNILDNDILNIVDIPNVYGFKYIPNSYNAQCCMYYMDKLASTDEYLIQLSFNYDRDYDQVLSSGRYMGIDTIKQYLSDDDVLLLVKAMGSMMALIHYGMNLDGYDIEFVFGGDYKLYIIDYDKVNKYTNLYPYIIKRKLTENDYDEKNIRNDNDVARLLASTIHYYPHPDYPEYTIWKENYINVAEKFNKQQLATKVLTYFESYF